MEASSKEARELAWISRAYFDAARFLVDSMYEDEFPDSPHRNRVPLYLCHHSLELLYKAVLLAAGKPCPKTHNIGVLRTACLQFEDCRFPIPKWLGGEQPQTADIFEDLPTMYFENLHERYRYVSDVKGRPLQSAPEVSVHEMTEEISALNKASAPAFIRIAWRTEN